MEEAHLYDMARRFGINGKLGNYVYYKLNGKLVRRKYVKPTLASYKKDPAFAKMRAAQKRFAKASTLGKQLRQYFFEQFQFKGDHTVSARLTAFLLHASTGKQLALHDKTPSVFNFHVKASPSLYFDLLKFEQHACKLSLKVLLKSNNALHDSCVFGCIALTEEGLVVHPGASSMLLEVPSTKNAGLYCAYVGVKGKAGTSLSHLYLIS